MKQRNLLAATVVAAGLFASAADATIVYNIDRTIGNGSVTGTITTDGTLGRLSNGVFDYDIGTEGGYNLVDWSFTLDDGHGTYLLNKSNSGIYQWGEGGLLGNLIVTNFYATEANLIYDFDASGYFMFQRYLIGDGGPNWLLEGSGRGTEQVYAGPGIYEYVGEDNHWDMYDERSQVVNRSDQVVIGWSTAWDVPGPHSLAILALGLVGLAGSRKLKRP